MEFTLIKHWSKDLQNDTVNHVTISYTEDGSDITKHEFGSNSTAAPEFYAEFDNLAPLVCKICGLDKKYNSAVSVREVKIAHSEDKEGDDNTTYTLISSFKAGHATATLKVSINHKYIPEGFEDTIQSLSDEAEEYLGGKRAQTELDLENGESEERLQGNQENDPENYEIDVDPEDNSDQEEEEDE